MKIKKIFLFPLVMLLVVSMNTKAQENITDLLNGSLKDANTIGKAYLDPFGKGFGSCLNNGWYNSAKPHKLFGFDVTFSFVAAIPPSSSKSFDVSKLNLEYWEPQTTNIAPTVTGSKDAARPILQNKTNNAITMTLPKGGGLPFVPSPIIQAGVGLPFNTELDFRFLPTLDIPKVGKLGLWGFGVKNEFKEFIPGFKALPFNVSAFFGYTKFTSSFNIDAPQPDNTKSQKLDFKASGYNFRILVSKSIPILTVYAGAGYAKSKVDADLKGEYNIPNYSTASVTDPISVNFDNSGFVANLGLRVKLSVIAFHFDYTVGKYALYNAGVGINFR